MRASNCPLLRTGRCDKSCIFRGYSPGRSAYQGHDQAQRGNMARNVISALLVRVLNLVFFVVVSSPRSIFGRRCVKMYLEYLLNYP